MLLAVLLVVGLGAAAFVLMVVKDRTYVGSAPFTPSGAPNPDVVVVYYSRSGHSEAVAREIARTFNARIARIDADYGRDFEGQSRAVADARAEALPTIQLEPTDLTTTKRLFLVSPTWLFRPAPPLWAFVEQTELTGKQVTLVMTGNSRFKQEQIDAFAKRVEARGGRLERHVFLRRGRIVWQLSREELLEATRAEVAGRR